MSFLSRRTHPLFLAGASIFCLIAGNSLLWAQAPAPAETPTAAPAPVADLPLDDNSPWGMGTSAEWSGEYPKFLPLLDQAGVKWMRLFPEWQSTEPKLGQFDWSGADAIVANAKANHIHIEGSWAFFAPWASADSGTRRGPIKDMQYWRDYVTASVDRYKKDIKYWEVWNEFNGSFYQGINKPKEYADLVVAAYDAAKKANPDARVGMSVANFDVGFLDAAIKAGAADHFDYICVHPYENLGALADGGEVGYLSLTSNLRDMLKANHQREDIPLWITEVGYSAPINPEPKADAKQAEMIVKGHLLTIAQGFQRIFWFEARGPSYGQGTDLGIIRKDWSPRPAYDAYKTMTTLLGPEPKYLGWVDIDKGAYGFVYQGAKGTVLAAWGPPGTQHLLKFPAATTITDLTGHAAQLPGGNEFLLSTSPVFVTDVPDTLASLAAGNLGKPYPWGGDYAHAQQVTCALGAVNREDGLKQINPQTTVVENGLVDSCRRLDFRDPKLHGEGRYAYFRVDPQFVPYGTKTLEITLVARAVANGKPASTSLTYESAGHGYTGAKVRNEIPGDDQWHELKWTLDDVNFVGQWGWNFRFDASGSPNEFLIKEVRVKKP